MISENKPLQRALKVTMWITISVVCFFLILAALVQLPAVQTKIVQKATTFISNKTHTKVEIEKVGISFPKSVVVEGLFLEDLAQDTLVYAARTKVNIALTDLLNREINIKSFMLGNATVKLYNAKTDNAFNYNFLTTAFSDTTAEVQTDTSSNAEWSFSLDRVNLKNVRFLYHDNFAGMNVTVEVEKTELNVDEIDLEKSAYKIDELFMDGLTAIVTQEASTNKTTNTSSAVMPGISFHQLQLNNSNIHYADSVGYMSVMTNLDYFEVEDGLVDLNKELLSFVEIDISKSDIRYHTFAPEMGSKPVNSTSSSNWKVAVGKMKLNDNSMTFKTGNTPVSKNEFDAENLKFASLSLDAESFYYDADSTTVSVQQFSAIDQNGFEISSLSADFNMNKHAITANKVKLNTSNSILNVDFNVEYESLDSLLNAYQFSNLNLNMHKVAIKNSDVLYFNRALKEQPFFQNASNTTIIKGKVSGPVEQLSGKKLMVKTGEKTLFETDFDISGLPEIETAIFDFPNLTIHSGKKDLMMAGALIPENIELPRNVALQLAFKGTTQSFNANAKMSSSFGDASFSANIDNDENFKGAVTLKQFDVGQLLRDTLFYGPVSISAKATGQGLEMESMKGNVEAEVRQLSLNQYNYQNMTLNGTINSMLYEGDVKLDDENAIFDLSGKVNLAKGEEEFNFKLNMRGGDLQKLNFTDDDIRMRFVAETGMKGRAVDKMNGTASISDIVVVSEDKTYQLESLQAESVNNPATSELNISSALFNLKYAGNLSPFDLPAVLTRFINNYFTVSDPIPSTEKNKHSKFNFEMQLHNHRILSDLLLPEINEFIPDSITGSFNSEMNKLELDANIKRIVYGTTEVEDFNVNVNANDNALNYSISIPGISNKQINISNMLVEGTMEDNQLTTSISSINENRFKKLLVSLITTRENDNYRLALEPGEFFLMNKRWNIAPGNFIEFGHQGVLFHRLNLNNAESRLRISSVNNQFNDDLNIRVENFKLSDLSGIVAKDSALIKGTASGNVLLKRVNNSYGLIADADISNLIFRNHEVGNLSLETDNSPAEQFNIDMSLSGAGNNFSAKGHYILNGGAKSLNVKTRIDSLSMKTIEAFSMGQITESSGMTSGDFSIVGRIEEPEITGQLGFNKAFMKPAFLNNRIALNNESIKLKKDGIYFNNFTVSDSRQNTAVLDGAVKMEQFSNFQFDFNVSSKEFLLFNTSVRDNENFFGRMIIDSDIDVSGPLDSPVVNARVKVNRGSNFTFVVPEDRLNTNKGEGVVEFDTGLELNSVLAKEKNDALQKSSIKGFDVTSVIEIDKEASLRLLMDPASTDSLVVKGEATLGFNMDKSGMMSLTGAYRLSEGSYLVSLESLIKKQFKIDGGSTIVWNGDPLNADININARHIVQTSPYNLIADELTGISNVEKNSYKQRYPFIVILKLRGEILQPEISFEIQLAPQHKGIMGGSVNQKLSILNNYPSDLNKQVFALLVLGRFIQENPFEAETGGASAMLRTTVSRFLSAQLNQLSSKVVPGVKLNFDIQSYDDYQSGTPEGRTQVEIGLKKQLFNERLSVQVGGTVDVEGEEAKQNSTSDIASDVKVEYDLNKDGTFRLKGFRQDQYEGAIEGQLVETGIGVVYVRDFEQWRRFFKKKKPPKTKPPKSPEGGP